jgi:hypothetical protein
MPAGQEMWGETLTKVATNMVQQVSEGYQQGIIDIQKDMANFALEAEKQTASLKEKQDEYNSGINYVDAMAYVRQVPFINFGESPQALYDRTVHAGNIGPACYTVIRDHAKNGLKLPTFGSSMKLIEESAVAMGKTSI